MRPTPTGDFAFYRPDGTPIDTPTIVVPPGDDHLRTDNAARGIHPTAETSVPSWAGERPDYGYIIDGLLYTRQINTRSRGNVHDHDDQTSHSIT